MYNCMYNYVQCMYNYIQCMYNYIQNITGYRIGVCQSLFHLYWLIGAVTHAKKAGITNKKKTLPAFGLENWLFNVTINDFSVLYVICAIEQF